MRGVLARGQEKTSSRERLRAFAEERGPLAAGVARATHAFRLTLDEALILSATVLAEVGGGERSAAPGTRADLRPTVGALRELLDLPPDAVRLFLAPGTLLRSGLIETYGDGAVDTRTVAIAPAFLAQLVAPPPALPRPDAQAIDRLVLDDETRARAGCAIPAVAQAAALRRPLVVAVIGPPGSGRFAVARAIAAAAGSTSIVVGGDALVTEVGRRDVRRASWWHGAVVIVDPPSTSLAAPAIADLQVPVFLLEAADLERLAAELDVLVVELAPPAFAQRLALWRSAIPSLADVDAQRLAGLRFGAGRIAAVARLAHVRAAGAAPSKDAIAWACRALPAQGLARHGARLGAVVHRADLVLPAETARDLDLAITGARHHAETADRWRADGRGRLPGLACLFAGPPGTGKTMAAQMLATELGVDMYRIDISQVVSKYIGETEKNLSRVFDEATAAGASLFFDEADALFGKRTKINDAHDRYANIETGYLLQRLEAHDGLSILATNLRDNIDDAFLRRMQFVVDFLAPGPVERAALWNRYLPRQRAADVDIERLAARFALTGADIRNAALTSELLAVDDGAPVAMRHVVIATALALRKQGRLVNVDDFGPWRELVVTFLRKS